MTENGNGRDTLTLMLQCRRSQATRETYRRHLTYFFRYSHLLPGMGRDAVERFERLLRESWPRS